MKTLTKTDVLRLISEHQQEITALGVKRCGVFGSFAREHPTDQSDVDILVEFEMGKKTFANFMHLVFLLEALFGRKVDVVTRESLSPYIGPHILREVAYVNLNP